MTSSVYWKWKTDLGNNYSAVHFDGPHISLQILKKRILDSSCPNATKQGIKEGKREGKKRRKKYGWQNHYIRNYPYPFTIQLLNSSTLLPFNERTTLYIPRNTALTVVRGPPRKYSSRLFAIEDSEKEKEKEKETLSPVSPTNNNEHTDVFSSIFTDNKTKQASNSPISNHHVASPFTSSKTNPIKIQQVKKAPSAVVRKVHFGRVTFAPPPELLTSSKPSNNSHMTTSHRPKKILMLQNLCQNFFLSDDVETL